jgi:hypothetical protein
MLLASMLLASYEARKHLLHLNVVTTAVQQKVLMPVAAMLTLSTYASYIAIARELLTYTLQLSQHI